MRSVERQPTLWQQLKSMLLFGGLKAHGPSRTNDYLPLPIWRKNAERSSCLDLITQLRRGLLDKPEQSYLFGIETDTNNYYRCNMIF